MAHDILIVDDEADIRALVSGILEDEGYQTREAHDSDSALAAIESRRPNLVLLDIWLQGSELDGLGILGRIKENHAALPVLMMSGHGTVETAVSAIKKGAYDFIEKPFKADRLLLLVERAIETDRLRRENEELRQRSGTSDRLIGDSPVMREIDQALQRVAPTNSRVLISGPAGAGKEVLARLIHAQSPRAAGSFVVVNCATMDPDRVEMELFGIEATSADAETRRVGMFEAAHNGTLYLDEVADMPLATQGKIVRVLQEQIFQRVGGSTRVEVDVRVIASATRDLPSEIQGGRFREDLYYRLNVVPFTLPPLSVRREDIPLLADHFMGQAAAAAGHPPREFGEDAMAALQSYEWPGNVRELRNVIERLLIMAPGDTDRIISADMLPSEITSDTKLRAQGNGESDIMGLPLRDAREIFERQYIEAQIARFGGSISRTAEFIGMERSSLHRKLKVLGILAGEEPEDDTARTGS